MLRGFGIISKGIYNTSAEYIFWINLGNTLSFELYDESVSSTYELAYYNSSLASYEGSWFHVCATYDGRGGTSANAGIKLYINGENVSTTLGGAGTYVAMENLGADVHIGRYDSYYADGKISNLAVYKTELDAQTISQMAKSRFTPMRDNRFSVVDFDGSNDFIQLPVPLSYTNHSISVWVNHTGTFKTIFASEDSSGDGIRLFTDDGSRLQYEINGSTKNLVASTAYTDQWVHYFCTYDGSTMNVCI